MYVMKKTKLIDKKSLLYMTLALMTILTFGFVTATETMNLPVTYSNYSGTITLNCTTNAGSNLSADDFNVTFYRSADGTGDTAATLIAVVNNETSATIQTEFIYSFATTGLTDGHDYNFTCQGYNNTDSTNSSGTANVTIDNTAPVVSVTTLDKDTSSLLIYPKEDVTMNWSSTDAMSGLLSTTVGLTEVNTFNTGCQIGGTIGWSTAVGEETLTGDETNCPGTYTVALSATDEAGNTGTATSSVFKVDEKGSSTPSGTQQTTSYQTQTTTTQNSVVESIKNFFASIFDWFKNLFSKL